MGAGRKPDVISTDLHQLSVNGPTFDLPTTLSKFLHLGMSLAEVIEAATVRSAQVLGLEREVGTLRPGSRADVALFRLYEGSFPLQDIHGNVREAGRLLRNTAHHRGRPRARPPAAAAGCAVDGRADLAGRADPVHREAAGAARAGTHARRDGRRGRGAGLVSAAYADAGDRRPARSGRARRPRDRRGTGIRLRLRAAPGRGRRRSAAHRPPWRPTRGGRHAARHVRRRESVGPSATCPCETRSTRWSRRPSSASAVSTCSSTTPPRTRTSASRRCRSTRSRTCST